MLNYIYGAVTIFMLITTVNMVDTHVSNDLMYWVDLYMPF
jgi:hypothetical protein